MSLCQVCGSSSTGAQELLLMRLRKEQVGCSRLLNKLNFVAQIKLPMEQALDICYKCVYKIEEFHYWLCSIRRHQKTKQDRHQAANTERKRPTNKADTEVLIKRTCKKNITLNVSFDEEEEVSSTSIPNGQQSRFDKVIPENNDFQELEYYMGNLLNDTNNDKPSNVCDLQSSLNFSYPTHDNYSNEIIKQKSLTNGTNDVFNCASTVQGNGNKLIQQKSAAVLTTRNEVSFYENTNENKKTSDMPITREEINNNENSSRTANPAMGKEIRNNHLIQREKPLSRPVKNNENECNELIKNKKPAENVKAMNKFDKVRDEILAFSFTQDEPDVLFDYNPFKSSNEVKPVAFDRNIALQSFNSWNLTKTHNINVKANPQVCGLDDPYNFASHANDFLPPKKNFSENATVRMPPINKFKRRCSSVDIFASQEDNNNPFRNGITMDPVTPSQDLIKRLRAKIQLKNPF